MLPLLSTDVRGWPLAVVGDMLVLSLLPCRSWRSVRGLGERDLDFLCLLVEGIPSPPDDSSSLSTGLDSCVASSDRNS